MRGAMNVWKSYWFESMVIIKLDKDQNKDNIEL